MPFASQVVEVVLDQVAQVGGPTIGVESGSSTRGDPHRVIRTTRAGGAMTFDRDGSQVLNGQRVWVHRRLRLGEPANERRTPLPVTAVKGGVRPGSAPATSRALNRGGSR